MNVMKANFEQRDGHTKLKKVHGKLMDMSLKKDCKRSRKPVVCKGSIDAACSLWWAISGGSRGRERVVKQAG